MLPALHRVPPFEWMDSSESQDSNIVDGPVRHTEAPTAAVVNPGQNLRWTNAPCKRRGRYCMASSERTIPSFEIPALFVYARQAELRN